MADEVFAAPAAAAATTDAQASTAATTSIVTGATPAAAAPTDPHDLAASAFEAYQADPSKPELKEAAIKAFSTAKAAAEEARKAAQSNQPPDKYALTQPKDSPLKPESIAEVEAFAKANKLTQTQAQAHLERESAAEIARVNQFTQVKEGWLKETMADKEIGGENLKAVAEGCSRLIAKFAPPELKADLDSTGLGNHPGLIKMLYGIYKQMAPDSLVLGNGQSGAEPKSAAAAIFTRSLPAAMGLEVPAA